MVEAGGSARLAVKATDHLRALGEVREQHLIATSRRRSRSRARYTVAIPPSPISSTSS